MENCRFLVQDVSEIRRQLDTFVERYATQEPSLHNLDGDSALPAFLTFCANSLTTEHAHPQECASSELHHVRDIFIRAGLDALADQRSSVTDWLQIGVQPVASPESQGELYRRITAFADRLLNDGAIENFFFMHKTPGLRLRFQTVGSGCSGDAVDVIRAEVARWRARGLIDRIEPGVYEPESRLFGGPQSMPFVHALFTVDSLIWLEYHSSCLSAREELSPAWLLSLALLRTVFTGLQIVGWEDIGVWDQITNRTGRHLDHDDRSLPGYSSLRADIRRLWAEQGQVVDVLHPTIRMIVNRYEDALYSGAAQWRAGYFTQSEARVGTRAAAAFAVIFHWNRGALPPMVQALLATSLAEREF